MFIDKIIKCPSCNTNSPTISLKEEGGNRFLHCVSCKAAFPYNKKDSFFIFSKEKEKMLGTLLSKYEIDFYSNRNFKKACINSIISNLKLALKEYPGRIVVDIGCGNGGYARDLKGLYQEYYGFEPSNIPDEVVVNKSDLPKNVILIHYDPTKNLPLHNGSVDIVLLIASYDHTLNSENLTKDIYRKLNNNGYLIIVMENYNFWIKNIINRVFKKRLFRDAVKHKHYCFHSPNGLIKEIQSFVNLEVKSIRADFFFLPNLPKQLKFIYFHKSIIIFMNSLIRCLFSFFSQKHLGNTMVVVFKKTSTA